MSPDIVNAPCEKTAIDDSTGAYYLVDALGALLILLFLAGCCACLYVTGA